MHIYLPGGLSTNAEQRELEGEEEKITVIIGRQSCLQRSPDHLLCTGLDFFFSGFHTTQTAPVLPYNFDFMRTARSRFCCCAPEPGCNWEVVKPKDFSSIYFLMLSSSLCVAADYSLCTVSLWNTDLMLFCSSRVNAATQMSTYYNLI